MQSVSGLHFLKIKSKKMLTYRYIGDKIYKLSRERNGG